MTEKDVPVGLTKSQGWEIGVRKTVPFNADIVWQALTSPDGLATWLGTSVSPAFVKGERFSTAEGIAVEVRSASTGSLIRMRYQPAEWASPSTLQVRLLSARTGTTISFHHEHLPDGAHREIMRQKWSDIIESLQAQMYALAEISG